MSFISYLITWNQPGQCVRDHRIGIYDGLRHCKNAEFCTWRCHHDRRRMLCLYQSVTSAGIYPAYAAILIASGWSVPCLGYG